MSSVPRGGTAAAGSSNDPVLVIGGGVVGLCIAYYLAALGIPTEVAERAVAGAGASWGNGGWVCESHSMPVAAPGVTRFALRSLGRPESPLYLNLVSDPSLVGWLWRFWRSSSPECFEYGCRALADFNRDTFELFEGLAADGVYTSLRHPGLVHAYLSVDEARHHLALQQRMAAGRYQMPTELATGPDATLADVSLAAGVNASFTVPGEGVVDPDRLVDSLASAVVSRGGKLHEHADVTEFRCDGRAVRAVLTNAGELPVSGVVIAGGSMSGSLTSKLGYRMPLQAGKGYSFSVELDRAPEHALYLGDKRIAVSPINGTTRLAGTMEFSGHNRALDWRRIVAIARASRHYLGSWYADADDLIARVRDPWVGARPMLPDGLPVIDKLPAHDNAYLATGHGMLGVTLGPATGRALADYVTTGTRPAVLRPFDFGRLGR